MAPMNLQAIPRGSQKKIVSMRPGGQLVGQGNPGNTAGGGPQLEQEKCWSTEITTCAKESIAAKKVMWQRKRILVLVWVGDDLEVACRIQAGEGGGGPCPFHPGLKARPERRTELIEFQQNMKEIKHISHWVLSK